MITVKLKKPSTILLKNCTLLGESADEGSYANILIKNGKVYKITEKIDGVKAHETFDLDGRTICSAFVDAHTHLLHFSKRFLYPDLSNTSSKKEAFSIVKDHLKKEKRGHLFALNFDETEWKEGTYPEREEIDTISSTIPLIFIRVCGHLSVLNSPALAHFHSWLKKEQFSSKELQKLVQEKKGFVIERGVSLLSKAFPISEKEKIEALKKAIHHFTALGITEIHDIFSLDCLSFYTRFFKCVDLNIKNFPLKIKGYLILPIGKEGFHEKLANNILEKAKKMEKEIRDVLRKKEMKDFFVLKGIKTFLDGSLGARTAALLKGYADVPSTKGRLLLSKESLLNLFEFSFKNEMEVMLHVIGDRALLLALETLEEFSYPLFVRLEHVEVLPDSLLERMVEIAKGKIKLKLSMMPNFAGNWSTLPNGMNIKRLGEDRYKICERFKSVYDAGLNLLFGSDCMPPDPIYGITSSVFNPNQEERLKLDEALSCYTTPLKEGVEANLVVLSQPLRLSISEEELKKVKVVATIFKGNVVWSSLPLK